MSFKEILLEKVDHVNRILAEVLPEECGMQKTIFESMNYSVNVGGKRLRPILMGETYRMFGGCGKEIEPFMAAMEMIHSSSLVHDDLPAMDNDEYRRGKKTTWVVYGEDMAILAGDALMIYAFETASRAFSYGTRADLAGQAIGVLANKTGIYGMIGGQTVDVELTGKSMTEEQLSFINKGKTAALLEASLMIGGILAGADADHVSKLERIGTLVGEAFQIQDDILDLTSTTEELGKPVHSDEKNEKTTYVVFHGLEAAKKRVESLTEEALQILSTLPGDSEFLRELLLSLVNRRK